MNLLTTQPLPWTPTSGREIADADGNVVQYTQATIGAVCMAVNAHHTLMSTLKQVMTWLESDLDSRTPQKDIVELLRLATGQVGVSTVATRVEQAEVSHPDLDRAISIELQLPEANFTGSTDTAMALAPIGWKMGVNLHTNGDYMVSFQHEETGRTVSGIHKSLSMATCVAALRTRS